MAVQKNLIKVPKAQKVRSKVASLELTSSNLQVSDECIARLKRIDQIKAKAFPRFVYSG